MSIKITHEDYVNRLAIKNPNLEVIGTYTRMKDPIEHRCKKHNIIWKTTPTVALKGSGCSKCCSEKISNKVKVSEEEYLDRLSKYNPDVELIGTYIDIKTPVKHRCKIHNIIWKAIPDNIYRGQGCSQCKTDKITKALTKTHDQYVKELKMVNPHIEVLESYINGKTPIKHCCTIHNVTWKVAPDYILKSYGCELCSKEAIVDANKLSEEEYCKRISEINPTIIPMEEYINMNTAILHCCTIHNKVWRTTPASILQGSGCPQCKSERISNSNSLTHEEYCKRLEVVNPNIIPLEKYIAIKEPILHKCLIHNNEWITTPASVLQGCGCKQCLSERISIKQSKTHEEYVSELEQINPNIEVLEKYTGADIKTLFKCKIDGFEWRTGAANVLSGTGCPKCAGNPRKTHDEYVQELSMVNPNIEVIGTYINIITKIQHRCKIHNYIWDGIPSTLLKGVDCPVCHYVKVAENLRMSHEEYVQRLYDINPNVICMEKYFDMKTPILHKCLIHDYEWMVAPNNLMRGHGCPKCGCRFSKGEESVKNWLDLYEIDSVRQKTFDDCRDKYPLPFDFYLPNLNKAIEFDGIQHFKPVEAFGGEEGFKITVLHDQIKNQYCEDNDIPLLRIPYYADIEMELSNFLLI